MKNFFRKSERNVGGTAAIEFAILLPFLLIMFFGAFEVARYILVIRKVENTVNDINFILSREGTIHDINGDGVISSTEDTGRIDRLVASLVPILMTPYETDNYEIKITAVARPTDAINSPDDARLMWAHKIKNNDTAARKAEVRPDAPSISGSTYTDSFGERAVLTFEGQTFLLINLAYGYNQVINNFVNYVQLNLEDTDIEKISTYAVRSRWIDDGDGVLQANEFYNQMQICTGCSEVSSDAITNPCTPNASEGINSKTSGCTFN
jgi:hypothetical protein